jgi:hypothetical protein
MSGLAIAIAANVLLGLVLLGVLFRRRIADAERLTEPAQALEQYRTLHPTAGGSVSIAVDGRAALLELVDGTVGLIERRGRRWSVRSVEQSELAGVDGEGDDVIAIRFADFGWPRSRVRLSDPVLRQHWIERLALMQHVNQGQPSSGGRRA